MDELGFFQPVDEELDLVKFLASNFEEFGRLICADNPPTVIIGDLSRVSPNPVLYCEGGAEFISDHDGTRQMRDNTLIIDEIRFRDLFQEQIEAGDLANLLIALWQVVFHELRHFVQCQKIAQEQECYFDLTVLDQLDKLSPGISEVGQNHIKTYQLLLQDENTLAMEIDAIVSSLLTLMHMMRLGSDGSLLFEPADIVRALVLTKHQLQSDPTFFGLYK